MKISEAMRLGATLKSQAFGVLISPTATLRDGRGH
jgi:hypothetical protein